jgi:O-antigen/teichoic acid export membrane protein
MKEGGANEVKVPELENVVKGTSLNFLGAISRSLFGTLLVFVLAKIMTNEEMGLFFLGINFVTVLTIIAVSGFAAGIRRYVSIAHGKEDAGLAWDYFNTSIIIVIPFVSAISLVMLVFSEEISIGLFSKPNLANVLIALIPFLILFVLSQLFLSVTQAYKQMKYSVICLDIVNNLLRILIALALASLGFSLYSGIWAYVIAILVTTMMAFHYFKKTIPEREKKPNNYKIIEMMSFSFPVTLSNIADTGNGLLATLLLGFFLSASDVGLYAVAIKIVAVGAIVLSSFNIMFSPLISQLHNQNKTKELKILFTCITRWVFSISLPVYILIAWYSSSIGALFGEEYIAAQVCIIILCLGQLMNALTGPSGNILLMSGYAFINLWTNLLGLIMILLLNVLLIPEYGIVGSAIAGAIAIFVVNIVRVYLAWKKLGLHPYELAYIKPVVAAIILFIILIFASPDSDQVVGIMQLLVYGILGVIGYFLALISLGLNQEDRYVFSRISDRLGKFKK